MSVYSRDGGINCYNLCYKMFEPGASTQIKNANRYVNICRTVDSFMCNELFLEHIVYLCIVWETGVNDQTQWIVHNFFYFNL